MKLKSIVAIIISLTLFDAAPIYAQKMEISPNGSRPSSKGPAEYFTGSVIVEPLFGAKDNMQSTGGLVTFEPGARSAWHTHPAGQILIVTAGSGWVQQWGGQTQCLFLDVRRR